MSNQWILVTAALIALLFGYVTSSHDIQCHDANVTYDDIEALNASCINLDNCKYDRVRDDLDSYNCNCGKFCTDLNTCCVDSEYRPKCPLTNTNIKCSEVYGGGGNHVFMVVSCKSNWARDTSIRELCKSNGEELDDPLLAIPVTNKRTGITYKNYFCAVCNDDIGEEQPVFWNLQLKSRSEEVLSSPVPELHYNTAFDAWVISNGTQNYSNPTVSFTAAVPEKITDLVHTCYSEVISQCSENWTDPSTARKCEAYMAIARFQTEEGLVRYQNQHCAICNFKDVTRGMECEEMKADLKRIKPAISSNTFFVGLFSLHDKIDSCEKDMVYDSLAKKCRKVYKG